jgi:hypothetical protein
LGHACIVEVVRQARGVGALPSPRPAEQLTSSTAGGYELAGMIRTRLFRLFGASPARVVLVIAVLLGVVVAATAQGDDRATAEALLGPIEHDAARMAVAADAVKQARDALERATRMRDANDEPRARLAESLGRHWAQVARDLVRAADAERAATTARLAADDAGARADRERSLLEEAIARQGRLRAELEGLDRTKQGADRTAPVGASLEAGAPTPGTKGAPGPRPAPSRGLTLKGASDADGGAARETRP